MNQRTEMKWTLLFSLLLVFACGGHSSDDADSDDATYAKADFFGRWAGTYSCFGTDTDDELIVADGTDGHDFLVTIHSNSGNPDNVNGNWSDGGTITIPEQTMGGYPGTATIQLTGQTMKYQQSGLGITCGGSNYARQ